MSSRRVVIKKIAFITGMDGPYSISMIAHICCRLMSPGSVARIPRYKTPVIEATRDL